MSARPGKAVRELLWLYARAGHGERNLGAFLRDHPEILADLGVALDLAQDDAAVGLALAPAIGRYKRSVAGASIADRLTRAERAAARLADSARRERNRVEIDVDVLLGELLSGGHKYIEVDLGSGQVSFARHVLVRARGALRGFSDLTSAIDERGLHLAWRAGRGGLNLLPQRQERGASVLHVDLGPRMPTRRVTRDPVPLIDVLVELGLV